MRKLLIWLFPPVGFVCGWMLGAFGSATAPGVVTITERPLPAGTASARFSFPLRAADPLPLVENAAPPVSRTTVPRPSSLREAVSYPSEVHRLAALSRLLETLSPAQFPSLRRELLSIETPPTLSLLSLFYRRWAQVAPEEAMEAAFTDWKEYRPSSILAVQEGWSKRDPAALLAYVHKLPPDQRVQLRGVEEFIYPKPGDLPPKDALRRIREIQGNMPPSHNAIGAIFREWAKENPEAAWQEALTLPSGGQAEGLRDWVLGRIIESQAASDLAAAAQFIERLSDGPERTRLQSSYISSLVDGNKRSTAKAYALSMPEGAARRQVLDTLANALMGVNKEEAVALIRHLPPGDLQDPTVFTSFFQEWIRNEPQSASEFLRAHISPDLQATVKQQASYEQIFSRWAVVEPRVAGEFLLQLPESVRGASLKRAVERFCDVNSVEATQWAVSLSPGSDRDTVMQHVGASLAARGVTEVTNWLNQLPPDSGKFAAIEGFARKIVSVSPDDALTWLRSEPNEGVRLERLRRVWNSWLDRDAAQRWRDTSPELSVAERAALR